MEENAHLIAVVVGHEKEEVCILSSMKKDRSLLVDALDAMLVFIREKKSKPFKKPGRRRAIRLW